MRAKLLLGLLAVLWIGMLLAVGMESVVKFDTPTLTRAVAFDEGRYVFHFFNKVEMILLAAMFVLLFSKDLGWLERAVFMGVGAALIIQIVWLFPLLSGNVDLILAGIKPPASHEHALYAWVEITKITLLSVLSFRLLLQFGK